MKTEYDVLKIKAERLNDEVKNAICKRMKELGNIKFNFTRINVPFVNSEGDFKPVNVVGMKYNSDYSEYVAYDEYGNEWSIQGEGTLDGNMELLNTIELKMFIVVKDHSVHM